MSSKICMNQSSFCNMISWRAYMIGQTATQSPNANQIYVACGSQCMPGQPITPCGERTCKQCGDGAVNGYRTSITRTYQMDTNEGEIYLKYQTFSVEYRMRIFNGETQIYDSGCLTESAIGETIQKLSFSGQSQELRVDIEPECGCADLKKCGTFYFEVSCAFWCSRKAASNMTFVVGSGGRPVKEGDVLNITADPKMVPFTAAFCNPVDVSKSDSISWSLQISQEYSYSSSGCYQNEWDTLGYFMNSIATFGQIVIGGQITISVTYSTQTSKISFTIRGTQPDPQVVSKFINSSTNTVVYTGFCVWWGSRELGGGYFFLWRNQKFRIFSNSKIFKKC